MRRNGYNVGWDLFFREGNLIRGGVKHRKSFVNDLGEELGRLRNRLRVGVTAWTFKKCWESQGT